MKYKLKFLADNDDADPEFFTSLVGIHAGEVLLIPETGMHHVVSYLLHDGTAAHLALSKSAQSSVDEAYLLAGQYKHWPRL